MKTPQTAKRLKEVKIVEIIENEKGKAIKYSDGTMECFMQKKETNTIDTEWGALYTYNKGSRTPFPVKFKEIPQVFVSAYSPSQTILFSSEGAPTTTNAPKVNLFRGTPGIETEKIIDIYAVGKWK